MPVSVVLPTFDRAAALRTTLPALLRVRGVDELVVVDDGSRDGTRALLAGVADRRVRVVASGVNEGAPRARNRGAAAATGEWLLFAEDDCWFPPEYVEVLLAEAVRYGADVVGAPMVHPRPGEPLPDAVARVRAQRRGDGGLDEVAGFPDAPVQTPLLAAPALVRRAVALELRFDEGYRGVAYREETDFFLRAHRAGYRCLLTPGTWFAEAGRWPGGQARPWLVEELWRLHGNWRFLRRHGRWLAERGLIASPARELMAFASRRVAQRLGRGGSGSRGARAAPAAPAAPPAREADPA